MFVDFFFTLRERGVPATPTSFLRLQQALASGLVTSIDEFYVAARAILIKSERFFDLYDQVFAERFRGATVRPARDLEIDEAVRALLEQWLQRRDELAQVLGVDPSTLQAMTPDELVRYFRERLLEQTEAHEGGAFWIGTGGTSPVGHSGFHPGGMRVGGQGGNLSAVKVALDRRYKDYARDRSLVDVPLGEALKRLRNMVPSGPRDQVDIDGTIRETLRQAGEIEIAFERSLKNRLQVVVAIDNGGWSMYPYIPVVQRLFGAARAQFRDVRFLYFHNTVYDSLWEDPTRMRKPVRVVDLPRWEPDCRWIFIGDASMAPYELFEPDGSITFEASSPIRSLDRLQGIADHFQRAVWLNPRRAEHWAYTESIAAIRGIFPMYELTLDGLEEAVTELMKKQ
ncbi:MAG: VWA domain-containing protein [Pseudomonadota bacterium]